MRISPSIAAALVALAAASAGAYAATSGAAQIRFSDLFRLPVGARGLEPTQKLLALDGHAVRMVGYMARREVPTPGSFVLVPMPVTLGDEDEGLSDDLPAAAIFVHLKGELSGSIEVPHTPGLVQVRGTLRIGAAEEIDGRVSAVRIELDEAATRAFLQLGDAATCRH